MSNEIYFGEADCRRFDRIERLLIEISTKLGKNEITSKLPLYSEVMQDIFGRDWNEDPYVLSLDEQKKCKQVYDFMINVFKNLT